MQPIEAAIMRTILYGDIFDFPMTPAEIHHFLIHDEGVSLAAIQDTLATSPYMRQCLVQSQGYIACAGRDDLIPTRLQRAQLAAEMWQPVIDWGRWIARLPFVRMVALTGALAMRNPAGKDEDFDYLIVTAPRRVWLTRAFVVLLVRYARLRRIVICPNYVLSETALAQSRQDLYIAHEIAQIVPIHGSAVFEAFMLANPWVKAYIPNANTAFHQTPDYEPGLAWKRLKGLLERGLQAQLGDLLENWERKRKQRKFARNLRPGHSAATLDEQQVKGHFDDHGAWVLQRYHDRLRDYGLTFPKNRKHQLAIEE